MSSLGERMETHPVKRELHVDSDGMYDREEGSNCMADATKGTRGQGWNGLQVS